MKKIICILTIITFFIYFNTVSAKEASLEPQVNAYLVQGTLKECSVAIVDLKTNTILGKMKIPDPGTDPSRQGCNLKVAVTPKQDQLYVIQADKHASDQYVHIIDINKRVLLKSILLGRMPLSNIKMKPDGSHVYISSFGSSTYDTLWDINTLTWRAIPIRMEWMASLGGMAITADGNKLFVGTDRYGIKIIDTASMMTIDTLPDVWAPDFALSRDEKFLYTIHSGPVNSPDILGVYEIISHAFLRKIKLKFNKGISPLILSRDGQTLFYTGFRQGLNKIDLTTYENIQLISEGKGLWGLAMSNNDKTIYFTDYTKGEMLMYDVGKPELRVMIKNLIGPEEIGLF